jgi:hypothetical protein
MIRLIDYATRKTLATIARADLNKWCEQNAYLPHSGRRDFVYVIAKGI